jgi:hypothetical protein
MWERIGASSGIIVGAIVLFVIFVVVLFLIERAGEKKKPRRKKVLYLVPRQQSGTQIRNTNASASERCAGQVSSRQTQKDVRSIAAKKIV